MELKLIVSSTATKLSHPVSDSQCKMSDLSILFIFALDTNTYHYSLSYNLLILHNLKLTKIKYLLKMSGS